jgi:hypothetical protein
MPMKCRGAGRTRQGSRLLVEREHALVHVGALLGCVLALIAIARASAASENRATVVLLERRGATTSLREALRIQLPREVNLEVAALESGTSTAARIRKGHEMLASRNGLVALWIERDDEIAGEHEVMVYFVGRSGSRALVEVLRVRAGGREEIDRAVAVKAVEVVEALQSMPRPNVIAPFAGASPPSSTPETPAVRSLHRLSLISELGGAVASSSASAEAQAGAYAGLGAALVGDVWRTEALVLARAPTSLSRSDAAGDLRATELDLFASIRGLWLGERIALGGFVGGGGRMVSVEGTTARGTPGRSDRVVPVLTFGPELRVLLAPWLNIRVAAGAELALRRQRFSLNAEPVLDLGPGRGVIEAALSAVVP